MFLQLAHPPHGKSSAIDGELKDELFVGMPQRVTDHQVEPLEEVIAVCESIKKVLLSFESSGVVGSEGQCRCTSFRKFKNEGADV